MDLARNGFIVFAISHLDGSCQHTMTKDGKDCYHGPMVDLEKSIEFRRDQLNIREKEVIELITEVCFAKKKGKEVSIVE